MAAAAGLAGGLASGAKPELLVAAGAAAAGDEGIWLKPSNWMPDPDTAGSGGRSLVVFVVTCPSSMSRRLCT
jgi:hypothetical protein